jgi:hypothetical protein
MPFHTLRYITNTVDKASLYKPVFNQSKLEIWCALFSETKKKQLDENQLLAHPVCNTSRAETESESCQYRELAGTNFR